MTSGDRRVFISLKLGATGQFKILPWLSRQSQLLLFCSLARVISNRKMFATLSLLLILSIVCLTHTCGSTPRRLNYFLLGNIFVANI